MRSLPTGTVTFLFTDVEGSTKLLHELGMAAYAGALAEHRRAIRDALGAHDGVEVDTQGDAFFIAFPTAPGALAAAAAARDALAKGPIHARMGLHSGTSLVTEEGYVGTDLHRAARPRASPPQGPLGARTHLPARQRGLSAAQDETGGSRSSGADRDAATLALVKANLDNAAFERAWSEGIALSEDEALEHGSLARRPNDRPSAGHAPHLP